MSGTTANKATQTSPVKSKKRSSSNKTAKTSTAGTRGSTTGANRKAATKKAASQKTAAKKPATRKVSKKAVGRKKTAAGQHKAEQKQPIPASDNSTPKEEKSLSWMSAQATSALRAVKASQAEKGQALLARTRKQAAAEQLDDDSLIKIAAGMPVDNEGLIEFSTEQPLEEQPRKAEAVSPAAAKPVMDERHEIADSSADVTPKPESTAEQALAEDALATPPAGQPQAVPAPSPPPPAKRSAVFQPVALAAGLVFAALLLGYYFWPDANDTPAIVATQKSNEIEAPASAAELDPAGPQGTTAEDVAAVPVVEVEEVAAVPVAQVEEVATAPIAEPDLEPADRRNESIPAAIIPSSALSGQPQTATLAPEPEPAPAEPSPPVSYQAQQPVQPPAQPAKPAQPSYRTPANGYYPQQRRPAYPQYYYR